jgi:hypothetical protein
MSRERITIVVYALGIAPLFFFGPSGYTVAVAILLLAISVARPVLDWAAGLIRRSEPDGRGETSDLKRRDTIPTVPR